MATTEEFGLKLNEKGIDTMNIKMERLATIDLTDKELDALNIVYDLCLEITRTFPKDRDIQAVGSGEVIILDELPRVRGILCALIGENEWRPR